MQGLFRHAQFKWSHLHAVKTRGVINQRRITACAHVPNDRCHLTYESFVESYVAIADSLQPAGKSLFFLTANDFDHLETPPIRRPLTADRRPWKQLSDGRHSTVSGQSPDSAPQ